MDKQKQMIEEIATEISRIVLSCPLNQGRNCDSCKFNDKDTISYDCQSYLVAEALYNAGYRKIPELPKETILTADDIAELLTIVAKETRKETAEKFAKMAYKRFIKLYQYNLDWKVDNDEAKAIFDEIAKEITGGK